MKTRVVALFFLALLLKQIPCHANCFKVTTHVFHSLPVACPFERHYGFHLHHCFVVFVGLRHLPITTCLCKRQLAESDSIRMQKQAATLDKREMTGTKRQTRKYLTYLSSFWKEATIYAPLCGFSSIGLTW